MWVNTEGVIVKPKQHLKSPRVEMRDIFNVAAVLVCQLYNVEGKTTVLVLRTI